MQRKNIHNIQLNDEDYDKLMEVANRLKGGLGINLSGPSAVRLIVSFQQGWNDQQVSKYQESLAQGSDDE